MGNTVSAPASTGVSTTLNEKNFKETLELIVQHRRSPNSTQSPKFFVLYAHDNVTLPGVPAHAEVVKKCIQWFKDLQYDVTSDRSPHGQAQGRGVQVSGANNDIVKNQLSLLPSEWDAVNVDCVLVFGSQLLGKYIEDHEKFPWHSQRDYSAAVVQACEDLQATRLNMNVSGNPSKQEISDKEFRQLAFGEINRLRRDYQQKMGTSFHEVLTELALVEYRLQTPTPRVFAIHFSNHKQCLPSSIVKNHSNIVRVSVDPADPYGGFFKLVLQLEDREADRPLYHSLIRAFDECAELLKTSNNKSQTDLSEGCISIRNKHLSEHNNSQAFVTPERQITTASIRRIVNMRCREDLSVTMVTGTELPVEMANIDLRLISLQRGDKTKFGVDEQPRAQSLVQLEELFSTQDLGAGRSVLPKRILIRGPPGVGKSALSRRIMYMYTFDRPLRDKFDLVLRLPLNCLEHDNLEQALWREYFQTEPNGRALATELRRIILDPRRDRSTTAAAELQILFILDGLDETAGWVSEKPELMMLLNRSIVIVTSRFDTDGIKGLHGFDLAMEAVGLSPENIWRYLANESIVSNQNASAIRRFIKSNSTVLRMLQIPLLLDILCQGWDELEGGKPMSTQEITMTSLYKAIIQKLWRKDLLTLKKESREIIDRVGDLQRLEPYFQDEIDLLGEIALTMIEKGVTVFDNHIVANSIRQLDQRRSKKLALELERNLSRLSVLRTSVPHGSEYTFTHSTFRDFFAARCLAQDLDRTRCLLVQKKYDLQYEMVWRFLAGQLSSDHDKLGDFIDTLEREPRDLVGLRHAHVQMNCLVETTSNLDETRQNRLYRSLSDFLDFEVSLGLTDKCISCNMEFPEHILLEKVANFDGDPWKLTKILGKRAVLSEKLCASVIQYASSKPKYPQNWLKEIFSFRSILPPVIVHELYRQSCDKIQDFYDLMSEIIDQNPLDEEIVPELIKKLVLADNDPSGLLPFQGIFFVRLISSRPQLPPEAINSLLDIMETRTGNIREFIADILKQQPRLNPDSLKRMVGWLSPTNDLCQGSLRILAAQTAQTAEASDLIAKLQLYIDQNCQLPIEVVADLVKFPALHNSLHPLLDTWIKNLKLPPTQTKYPPHKHIPSVVDAIQQISSGSVGKLCLEMAKLLEHPVFAVRRRAKFWLQPELDPRRAPILAPELLATLQRAVEGDPWTTASVMGSRLGCLVKQDPVCWLTQQLTSAKITIRAFHELLQQLPWLESHSEQVVQDVISILGTLRPVTQPEDTLSVVLSQVAKLDKKTLDHLFSLLEGGNKFAAAILKGREQARGRLLALLRDNKDVREEVVTAVLDALVEMDTQTFSDEVKAELTCLLAKLHTRDMILDNIAAKLLCQPILPLETIQTLEAYMKTSRRTEAVKTIRPPFRNPWSHASVQDLRRHIDSLDLPTLRHIFTAAIMRGMTLWIDDGILWIHDTDGSVQKTELKDPSRFRRRFQQALNTPDFQHSRLSWINDYGSSMYGAGLVSILVFFWWRRRLASASSNS